MTDTDQLSKRLPNDIGGTTHDPIVRTEHEMEPWEKRCHALADVLDFHKIINTEAVAVTLDLDTRKIVPVSASAQAALKGVIVGGLTI